MRAARATMIFRLEHARGGRSAKRDAKYFARMSRPQLPVTKTE
jgi:hypothetical protein